jgi:ATP-dependent RNA helicase RhlE
VKPVSAITQVPLKVKDDQKLPSLLEQLKETDGLSIVFVRTKRRADKLTNSLREQEIEVCQIHGGRSQKQREVALQGLRKGRFKVMIATDIAARGIDVPEINLVVNYDLPYAGEDYLHRIGRTARAGREGRAVCFITPQEEPLWRSIERLMARTTGRSSKEQREDTEKFLKAGKKSGRGGKRRERGGHRGERSNSWKGSQKRSFRRDKTDERFFNDSNRGERSDGRNYGRSQNFRLERSGEKRDFTPRAPKVRFGSSNERSFGDSNRGEQRGEKRSFSSKKNESNDSRDYWSNRKPDKKKFGSSSKKPFGKSRSRGPKNSSRSSSRQR